MKRFHTRVPGSIQKTRLDEFLFDWLLNAIGKQLSRSKMRILFFSGAVYVNRHRNKNPTTPVYAGAVIEVYYDEEKLNAGKPRMNSYRLESSRIVYEDDAIIIVDKPSGLPTQPTLDPFRANLFDVLKRYLSEREKCEDHYVGLHHRLDKDTSGLVLFTKKEIANKGVSELFLSHQIQKTYQCLAWRGPGAPVWARDDEFKIENFIGRISPKGKTARYGEVTSGGDYAMTYFRVIDVFRDVYWLEVKPHTGRTHQIRVHCYEAGIPILGDEFYFPEKVAPMVTAPRLLLHAAQLSFKHPLTQKEISVSASLPVEFLQVLGPLKQ